MTLLQYNSNYWPTLVVDGNLHKLDDWTSNILNRHYYNFEPSCGRSSTFKFRGTWTWGPFYIRTWSHAHGNLRVLGTHTMWPQHMFRFISPSWQYYISKRQWQFNWLPRPLVLCWIYLFLMGLKQYVVDHETFSTWCHVGCHVDFSSIQFF